MPKTSNTNIDTTGADFIFCGLGHAPIKIRLRECKDELFKFHAETLDGQAWNEAHTERDAVEGLVWIVKKNDRRFQLMRTLR